MRKPCNTWLHACTCCRQRLAEHAARWDRAGPEDSVQGACTHLIAVGPSPILKCSARACQTEPASRAQFNEMRERSDGCAREGMPHECASTEKRRSARTVKGLASLGSET